MTILNYKLSKTNELLTSRTGLLAVTHLMDVLGLDKIIDQHFPALKSNRSLPASTFINALILSQHDGGECLPHITRQRLKYSHQPFCTNPASNWCMA